jgi:hypothetical protein
VTRPPSGVRNRISDNICGEDRRQFALLTGYGNCSGSLYRIVSARQLTNQGGDQLGIQDHRQTPSIWNDLIGRLPVPEVIS